MSDPAPPAERRLKLLDVLGLMRDARERGLVRRARKTEPVDARPAKPGEVVETVIAGEGKETRSRPAEPGDWVVRNRCPATLNEEYLVARDKFHERYLSAGQPPNADGWQEHRPLGKVVCFFVLGPEQGEFSFEAPWGEQMRARPGDAIVQDPEDLADTYRVTAAAFACTYEVLD